VQELKKRQLHFARPQAYHDIHNHKNRWEKEKSLYHSFGEDRSSFGFLNFKEARERRDVVSRMFSPKAVERASGLVLDKVNQATPGNIGRSTVAGQISMRCV
jgi:cytochrome P450